MASLFVKGKSGVNRANHFIDYPIVPAPVQISLEVDGDEASEYLFEYSLTAGASWVILGTSASDYDWALSTTAYANIFADGDSKSVVFRATQVTDNQVIYTTTVTIYKTSFTSISLKPKTNDTIEIPGEDPYVVANHNKPFWYLDIINFLWSYEYDTPTVAWDIKLERLNSSGDVIETVTLYNDLGRSVQNLAYNFGHYTKGQNPATGAPTMAAGDTKEIWRVVFTGDGIYDNDVIYGQPFAVTATESELYDVSFVFRPRLDLHQRTAGEKAFFLDEFPIIAQFEAGENVTLTQRDAMGRRALADGSPNPNDPVDYKKAGNLVFDTTLPEVPRSPRVIQKTFVPNQIDTNWQAGDIYYGTAYYYELEHNWELGNTEHPLYVGKQTPASFHLQVNHITEGDPTYDFENPVSDIIPFWQIMSKNIIRIYIIRKDNAHKATLEKDWVYNEARTYNFELRLVEVIPNPEVL